MKAIPVLAAALLAAGCAMEEEALEMSPTEEARLAEALEGRVRGEPQDCVPMRAVRGNRSIGDSAILFEGVGDTVWVNRPAGGCPSLDFGRSLLITTTMTQLCRGEIVSVIDPVSGTSFGGCGLGEFVPYRRP